MQPVHSILSPPPDDPACVFRLGTVGGLVSQMLTWLANRMDAIDHALATLTHIVGLCVAILTFMLLLRRWRNTRCVPPPREPADIEDDFPHC